jgi:hypothetical protein
MSRVGCLGVLIADKRFEISNHELIRDMGKFLNLEK